jgi:hypothetical protein
MINGIPWYVVVTVIALLAFAGLVGLLWSLGP